VAWAAWAASGLASSASFSTPSTPPDVAFTVLDPSAPSPQRLRRFSSPAIQGDEEQSSLPGGLRGVLHAARVKPRLSRCVGADAPYRTDTFRAAGRVRGKGGAFAGYEKEAAANAAPGRSLVAAVSSAQVTCLCPWCAFEVTPRRAPGRKPGASLYTRNRLSPYSASLYTTKRLSRSLHHAMTMQSLSALRPGAAAKTNIVTGEVDEATLLVQPAR